MPAKPPIAFRRIVLTGGAYASILAFAAASSTAADFEPSWSNGHKLESEDGSFKLKYGGRIQADWTFTDLDEDLGELEDGFEFRRARLFFSGTIYDRIEFKAQYDFAGGDADIKDLYIGILNDWGTVRFGHYKEYFSLEEQTSSKYISFVERSLPVEAFSTGRNSGVGVHDGNDRFNWGVGAFYDADDFGQSVSEDSTNVTARFVYRPIYQKGESLLHVGAAGSLQDRGGSMRFRSRPENHLAGRFVDTSSFAGDGGKLLAAEVAGAFGPLWFATEYMQYDVDAQTLGDPALDGYYAQVGWFITGEHRSYKTSAGAWDRIKPAANFGKGGGAWEVAVRFSGLDLTDAGLAGGEQDNLSLGLNWYLNPATRMMLNWVQADVDDVGKADFVALRWQVDF